MVLLEWLLLATGFTGGLTLVFLLRGLYRMAATPAGVKVYFSPKGGCTDAIVREINAGRQEVLVHAYAFSCRPLAQALVDAKMRGLRVDVLLDWGAEKDAAGELKFLLDQGLTPLINAQYMSSHDKVVLIDGQTVITGSFDFTQQAEEENAENLVVIQGQPAVVKVYRDRFEAMKAKCQPPGAKATPGDPNQKKAA